MPVKKQIFKLILTDPVVQEILQNGGGEIRINTSLYPDLNSIDQEYWKYHSPYGSPGDELIILEDYAIREVGQTSAGFYTVLEYRDGTQIKRPSRVAGTITPKNCFLNASSMPSCFSRITALIQDIEMSIDNSQWIFIISQTNLPTMEFDWSLDDNGNVLGNTVINPCNGGGGSITTPINTN